MSQMEGTHLAQRVPPSFVAGCRTPAGTAQSSTGWHPELCQLSALQRADTLDLCVECGTVLALPPCDRVYFCVFPFSVIFVVYGLIGESVVYLPLA